MPSNRLALCAAFGGLGGLGAVGALGACGRGEEPVSSASSALVVGPEVDLASMMLGAPPETQHIGTLVKTPTGYLAVWSDGREGLGIAPPPAHRTYFARIAQDGTVIDPAGIPLPPNQSAFWTSIGIAGACEPSGTCLLVALDGTTQKLLGVRVAGDQVLDAIPRVLFDSGTNPIDEPEVAWDGSAYRVIWRELIADTVWTASVATDLTVAPKVSVATPANNGHIACQGPSCLVVYRTGTATTSPVRAKIVDGAGAVGPELPFYQQGGRTFPGAPYWDGQYYWVGLTNNQIMLTSQYGASVQVVRVAPDGSSLDPDGIVVAGGDPLMSVLPPLLGHDGTTAAVIWNALSHNNVPSVKIARVTGGGATLDPGGVPFSTSHPVMVSRGDVAAVACHPPACLAAWTMTVYLDERVHGTRFSGITQLDAGGIEISRSVAGTMSPAVTYGLGRYVAVWRDSRDWFGDPRVSPIRGASFGAALAPVTEFELAMSPQAFPFCRDYQSPVIGASASSYLVVWHDTCSYYNNLYGQILDGSAQPGATIVVDNSAGQEAHPSVASDGSSFLVAWDNIESQNPVSIHARRFTASGGALGAAFPVSTAGNFPVVAFDGANYLVAWRRVNGTLRDLYAAQVSPSGAVGPELTLTQTPTRSEEGQSVACGGGTCLVAWRAFDQIRATRLSPAGGVLDPTGFLVGAAAGQIVGTSMAWDGGAFVVVWHTASQLRMQRVSAAGTLLTTTNPTLTPPTVPDRPAVASNGAGHLVALYDRLDTTAAFRVRRVRARSIVDNDAPPPVDAGMPDAPPDAPVDAPPPDAPVDAPPVDAGLPDAPPDAPPVDAALPDASPDAAMPVDAAGTPDAGAPPIDPPKGCSCSGGGGGDPSALGLLVLLVLRRRPRRRR